MNIGTRFWIGMCLGDCVWSVWFRHHSHHFYHLQQLEVVKKLLVDNDWHELMQNMKRKMGKWIQNWNVIKTMDWKIVGWETSLCSEGCIWNEIIGLENNWIAFLPKVKGELLPSETLGWSNAVVSHVPRKPWLWLGRELCDCGLQLNVGKQTLHACMQIQIIMYANKSTYVNTYIHPYIHAYIPSAGCRLAD